jgi:hypothetical protein
MGFGPPPPGGPEARFLGAEAAMPGRIVKNAPFSADIVTESTQTLSDGNHNKRSNTVKLYRDSEGRTRREQSPNLTGLTNNANMPSLVFIHDPVAGVTMALNANNKSGTRSTFTPNAGPGRGPRPHTGPNGEPEAVRPRRNPANDPNLKTESLGTRSFDGVMAEGKRTTLTIPAGQMGNEQPLQIVNETWYSSELQAVIYQKHTDPRNGETVTHFNNISRAEPARTMFDAPADYKMTESSRPRPRGGAGPGQIQ